MTTRSHFPVRKALRVQEAGERAAERSKRTDEQQLSSLDAMFGAGEGAKRERARLSATIANRGNVEAAAEAKAASKADAKAYADMARREKNRRYQGN